MAIKEIQDAFVDGIHEVFTTLFNEGVADGVYFYPFNPNCKSDNVYKERIGKQYLEPILLVAKVTIEVIDPTDTFRVVSHKGTFRVTYKSLRDNKIDVSLSNLKELEKGLIKYKDMVFEIENIEPTTYVEDVFLTYEFHCKEKIGDKV